MITTKGNGPGVRFPPPLLYVAGFLVGWVLDNKVVRLWPTVGGQALSVVDWIGGLLFGAGLAIAFSGIATFRRAKTSIAPIRDASRLVTSGPYRFTRNPMYTGLALQYIGLAVILSTGWSLLLLPLVLWGVFGLVIVREERYLTDAFGDEYRAYQGQVGRWW